MLAKLFHKFISNNSLKKDIDKKLALHRLKKSNLHECYYHRSITREIAEKLLIDHYKTNKINGCFLVRPCSTSNRDYALSMVHEGVCYHFRIENVADALYVLGDGPLINGLDRLIKKYQEKQHGFPCSLFSTTFITGELLPLEARTNGIKTLLHETVAEVREIQKLKLILNSPYCPDINERDEEGRTALDIACEYDNVEAIKELMKKKPLTNLKANDGYTPLHRAAEHNSHCTIDYLLSNTDADPTERLFFDNSVPLHIAAANNNFMCVKMLLKHNVPDKPRTNEGKTPIDIATENNFSETIDAFNQHKPEKPKTKSKEWLHESNVTREIAYKILFLLKDEHRDNVFLVRRSNNSPNQYVLSLMISYNNFFNYEICSTDNQKHYYIDDGPLFNSLEHLTLSKKK